MDSSSIGGDKGRNLVIGARQSDLARLQAYEVGESLLRTNPDISIKYHFRQSLGDKNQDNPLWEMPEKGVFTKDFRQSLIKGDCDLVVHSWKDLPLDCDPPDVSQQKANFHNRIFGTCNPSDPEDIQGTALIATLKRADARDLLLFKKNHLDKVFQKKKLCLFSSSPRRSYNLTDFFKTYFPSPLNQICFKSVRGNILTRISKLMEDGGVDALVVAKAAIDRLLSARREEFLENKEKLLFFLEECLWQVLPLSRNPTAPGQGALAVEALSGRKDLKSLLSSVHCQQTWKEVCRERAILGDYGGGCHQKIGVTCLHRSYGDMIFLRGETEKGEVLRKFYWEGHFTKKDIHVVKGQWFHSEKRDYVRPSGIYAHFVARAKAVPKSEAFDPFKDIVWVSGQKTWEELAGRGIWVHGSSESLGERENRRIELLVRKPLSWLKWTHSGAPRSSEMKTVATYELVPKDFVKDISDLRNYTKDHLFFMLFPQRNSMKTQTGSVYKALYWRSGSQFQRAVENQPELLMECEHFCGPGNTFSIISEILKKKNVKKQPKIIPMEWILKREK